MELQNLAKGKLKNPKSRLRQVISEVAYLPGLPLVLF